MSIVVSLERLNNDFKAVSVSHTMIECLCGNTIQVSLAWNDYLLNLNS